MRMERLDWRLDGIETSILSLNEDLLQAQYVLSYTKIAPFQLRTLCSICDNLPSYLLAF